MAEAQQQSEAKTGGGASAGGNQVEAEASLRAAAPGLARIAATAWWHTAQWTVSATARAYGGVIRAAANSSTPGEFFEETSSEVRGYARRFLGLVDQEGRIREAVGLSSTAGEDKGGDDSRSLRARGSRLLEESADVRFIEELHPAFARILEEITPDEARILRLLTLHGPQPAVDIRAGLPMVSDLVKGGTSMIDAEAGLRHTHRLRVYLTNLNRLGLIWFSRETLGPHDYQVLEAQPDVLDAMKKGGRTARTVRRSILLTQFGQDFCRTVLPFETTEMDALPANPDTLDAEAEAQQTNK